jgi:aspartyl/asparaginyl-tRNA synthetase
MHAFSGPNAPVAGGTGIEFFEKRERPMERVKIKALWQDAASFAGKTITVCGWGRTIRDMKNFGFLELNDGSSFKGLQVVLSRENLANYDELVRQNVGAAFIARGELVLTPDAPQPFEMKAVQVEVTNPMCLLVLEMTKECNRKIERI